MEINEPDFNYAGIYTYADYLKWTIEERLELIKGKIFELAAPAEFIRTLPEKYSSNWDPSYRNASHAAYM